MEVIGSRSSIVSKLVDFTYLRDLQPTYIGVITQLLTSMDIPVAIVYSFFVPGTPVSTFMECINALA